MAAQKCTHLKLHFFHVVVVLEAAPCIDEARLDLGSEPQSREVLLVDSKAFMEGVPQPREAVEDVGTGNEVERRRYSVEAPEDVNGLIAKPHVVQRPADACDALHSGLLGGADLLLGDADGIEGSQLVD